MSEIITPETEHALWPAEVSFGEIVYAPGGHFGPRIQEFIQLVLVHSGAMTVWIDERPYHSDPGTVTLLLPEHIEHFQFAADRETHHTWLHHRPSQFEAPLRRRLEQLPRVIPLSQAMQELIRAGLNLRHSHLSTVEPLLKSIATQMVWRYIGEAERASTGSLLPETVERAQTFIETHLGETITLQNIAQAIAVSESHLIRLFREHLGITPIAYLWQQRVMHGIELLKHSGLPVGVIAEQCGFQTSYHFSRRVKQATGCPPLEVRRRSWRQ